MDPAQLQLLLDRTAISDTVIRYATGIDMRDWAAYRSCFTDDVEIDFTSWNGGEPSTMAANDWVALVRATLSGFASTQHISTNHVIAIDGNHATCVSYMQAQHYLPNAQGDSAFTLGGYYTNRLLRTAGGWKICGCRLTVTWSTGNRHVFEIAAQRRASRA